MHQMASFFFLGGIVSPLNDSLLPPLNAMQKIIINRFSMFKYQKKELRISSSECADDEKRTISVKNCLNFFF